MPWNCNTVKCVIWKHFPKSGYNFCCSIAMAIYPASENCALKSLLQRSTQFKPLPLLNICLWQCSFETLHMVSVQ